MESNQSSQQHDEISLKEFILKIKEWWKHLLSKWILIFIAGIAGGTFGLVYALIKKPIYVAKTTFVLESGNAGGLNQYSGLASMVGLNILGNDGDVFQGDNILELYKSRTMIENALMSEINVNGNKQLLIDQYTVSTGLRKKWAENPQTKEIDFKVKSRTRDSLISYIVENINKAILFVEKPDKKLSLIKVTVRSNDEVFSKNFNNKIVQVVNDFYVETKTKKSLANISILQHQTDSVKSVMYGAISRSANITDATPNLNPTRQILRSPIVKSQANAEANKAVYSELIKNLELAKIAARKDAPLIQVVDGPILPLERDKISKLKASLVGMIILMLVTGIYLIVKKIIFESLEG